MYTWKWAFDEVLMGVEEKREEKCVNSAMGYIVKWFTV